MILPLPPIIGLTSDSREVKQGFLFVAIVGHKMDGRNFIAEAIARGAIAVAVPKGTPKTVPDNITWLEVDSPREYLASAAAAFYVDRPETMVAVTGTNGKTSTVNFCRQIWSVLGIKGASLGTLGLLADEISDYNGMTTPDAVALHRDLKRLVDANINHLAMEASSQGMDQGRLHGLKFQAAGFTNLTQDHLDYHGTMAEYLNAKLMLVRHYIAENGTVILNADDPAHKAFADLAREKKYRVWTYGINGQEFCLKSREAVPDGQILQLEIMGQAHNIHLPLVGLFQTMNVLCALGLVCADKGVDVARAVAVLPHLEGIVGRLQKIKKSPVEIGAYIDFAHTPDGLESVLNALRPHTTGHLVCVFGCGGDRDRRKRPIMGEIATRLADVVIVTDDNPRSEDPEFIRSEILVGAPSAISIGGRSAAILHAVKLLRKGDVLVVAGKGHEQGQIFATHTDPFDDYTETESALLTYAPSLHSA